jgi:hypothetical protein
VLALYALLAIGWLVVTVQIRAWVPGPLGIVLSALWPVVPFVVVFVLVRILTARDRRRLREEEFRD